MISKKIRILHGEIKTPPISREARLEIGSLLRELQEGEILSMPHSRPMPSIGPRCHELRVRDEYSNWRVMYLVDTETIIVLEVFAKKTEQTPQAVVEICKTRIALYLAEQKALKKAQKAQRQKA